MRRLLGCMAAAGLLAAPAAAAAAVHVVTIDKMAFAAPPPVVRVGDTVEWVNRDIFQHTATAKNGAFDVDLPPKARRRVVVQRAGRLDVYCRYHPGMRTVLNVAAK